MIEHIKQDFERHRIRAIAEILGMLLSLGVSLLLALTTPHVPMLMAYCGWLVASLLLCACSWHRGSIGLMMTYGGFLIIDTLGLLRTVGVL